MDKRVDLGNVPLLNCIIVTLTKRNITMFGQENQLVCVILIGSAPVSSSAVSISFNLGSLQAG